MDFIVGLLKYEKKSIIMVIVDRLSKYTHLCVLFHPFMPPTIAQVFLNHILKSHCMPYSIVTNCDPTFTNKFWHDLFKL
jgi:hypothetical protein